MFTIAESRIEELLEEVADEHFNFQNVYDNIKIEQEFLFAFLNAQEISFFTRQERAYFEFVVQFLWHIKTEEKLEVRLLDTESLVDREDSIWGLVNEKFSQEGILSSLGLSEVMNDLILDLLDDETTADISDIGREWIFVKTATIASLVFED